MAGSVDHSSLELSEEEFVALARLIHDENTSPVLARRSTIILMSAEGRSAKDIAELLNYTELTVYKWRRRYRVGGLSGLQDLARPGQPRRLSEETRSAIIDLTKFSIPDDATFWSIRRLARFARVSEHQVRQIWDEAGISGLSKSAAGEGNAVELLDLIGVYLAPRLSVVVFQTGSGATNPRSRMNELRYRGSIERASPNRISARIYPVFRRAAAGDEAAPTVFERFLEQVSLAAPVDIGLLLSVAARSELAVARISDRLLPRAALVERPRTVAQLLFDFERRCSALEVQVRQGSMQRNVRAFRSELNRLMEELPRGPFFWTSHATRSTGRDTSPRS